MVAVGDGAIRERLETRCNEEKIEGVLFTGLRPKQEMASWLSLADVCFVHLKKTPLFETVIPSKIFESAGLRRPILIGVNGDARDLVEASQGGWAIEPEDDEQLIDRLLQLKSSPEVRSKLGESGHRYVKANFNRDKLAQDYLGILTELA